MGKRLVARSIATLLGASLCALLLPAAPVQAKRYCPSGMANVQGRYCIDRYEATLDVTNSKGRTLRRHSPYHPVKKAETVKARVRRGVTPQAYITQREAKAACEAAGKRLCTNEEWVTACKGKSPTTYPYGDDHVPKRCNDSGVSPLRKLHGKDESTAFGFDAMNDPKLNKIRGTVARTGAFRRCRNSYGLYDMVGNLHEWTSDPGGTFRGGYYLDTSINGNGCDYKTTAHNTKYRDYSIGFRCCKSLKGGSRAKAVTAPKPTKPKSKSKQKPADSGRVHVVAKGHTLGKIARRYRVKISAICDVNGIDRNATLKIGQRLKIPE